MQDSTFITRAFVVFIVIILLYAANDFINHKHNLEKLVIDQQSVIDEQSLAIDKLRQANLIMYQHITQQKVLH